MLDMGTRMLWSVFCVGKLRIWSQELIALVVTVYGPYGGVYGPYEFKNRVFQLRS
jgi:hypothetical protein